jgi:hypothetical protein
MRYGDDNRRDELLLFCLALVVRLAVAVFIRHPGYMDPDCYAAGAVRLAQGGGLSEPFLWNYLDDPAGIPHPGFLYWMPLPSLLAAPFAALFPGSFFALQLPFALLSAMLPLVAYGLTWQIAESFDHKRSDAQDNQRRAAWLAGLFTLFGGFFFPFWTLPETFVPFALFGSLALWLATAGIRKPGTSNLKPFLIGVLAGLAHLTRADGILLLPVVALAPLIFLQLRNTQHAIRNTYHVSRITFVILGYLLVMTPWFLRNLSVIGSPLSTTGTKTLWLTNYDDLFCYGCDLSLRSYLAWGWHNILRSKLFALWTNFQRFWAENCLIFLLPFTIIGFYRLRRRPPFILSLIYFFLIYLTHSLAFTFPGWRGGFFHASGVLLPFLYAAAVEGLDVTVGWVARRRRNWNRRQAKAVFATAAVVGAVALSVYATAEKLPVWKDAGAIYRQVDRWLDVHQVSDSTVIMIGNPPGFWYHTHRPAVVVPNGDVAALLAAAEQYRVEYLLLDWNHPAPLAALYAGGESNSRLRVAATWGARERRTILYFVE